jgi:hypothetical protein
MSDQVAGKAEASNQLKQVAGSPAIDLMEVGIARDLLAAPRKYTPPANVAIP